MIDFKVSFVCYLWNLKILAPSMLFLSFWVLEVSCSVMFVEEAFGDCYQFFSKIMPTAIIGYQQWRDEIVAGVENISFQILKLV